jgi:hypothetical protein
MTEESEQEGMRRRRITLADGRYLIFYTFDEQASASSAGLTASAESKREPGPEAQMEEERRV